MQGVECEMRRLTLRTGKGPGETLLEGGTA